MGGARALCPPTLFRVSCGPVHCFPGARDGRWPVRCQRPHVKLLSCPQAPFCMQTAPSELARSALDAAPDAMIIIDASGVIRFANRQVSALFGYRHDDI